MRRSDKIVQRITVLWFIILLGLMYHIILHLTPVFYGIDIVKPDAQGVTPVSMVVTYGLSFFIPVLAIVNVQYLKTRIGRLINIILSFLALLINTAHLSEIVSTGVWQVEQLFVLVPLFLVAVLLFVDAIKWIKG